MLKPRSVNELCSGRCRRLLPYLSSTPFGSLTSLKTTGLADINIINVHNEKEGPSTLPWEQGD